MCVGVCGVCVVCVVCGMCVCVWCVCVCVVCLCVCVVSVLTQRGSEDEADSSTFHLTFPACPGLCVCGTMSSASCFLFPQATQARLPLVTLPRLPPETHPHRQGVKLELEES